MLWKAGQHRLLVEADRSLQVLRIGVMEGVLEIEVAKKRLKRRGPPTSLLPKARAKGMTIASGLWEAVDRFAAKVGRPERVRDKQREESDADVPG